MSRSQGCSDPVLKAGRRVLPSGSGPRSGGCGGRVLPAGLEPWPGRRPCSCCWPTSQVRDGLGPGASLALLWPCSAQRRACFCLLRLWPSARAASACVSLVLPRSHRPPPLRPEQQPRHWRLQRLLVPAAARPPSQVPDEILLTLRQAPGSQYPPSLLRIQRCGQEPGLSEHL